MPHLAHVETALIIEDDFLLARNLADELERLGCQTVEIASTVDEALRVLQRPVQFATVDVKIGNQPCTGIVNELLMRNVPFIYVSGYREGDVPDLPKAPWANKPLHEEELLRAIALTGLAA